MQTKHVFLVGMVCLVGWCGAQDGLSDFDDDESPKTLLVVEYEDPDAALLEKPKTKREANDTRPVYSVRNKVLFFRSPTGRNNTAFRILRRRRPQQQVQDTTEPQPPDLQAAGSREFPRLEELEEQEDGDFTTVSLLLEDIVEDGSGNVRGQVRFEATEPSPRNYYRKRFQSRATTTESVLSSSQQPSVPSFPFRSFRNGGLRNGSRNPGLPYSTYGTRLRSRLGTPDTEPQSSDKNNVEETVTTQDELSLLSQGQDSQLRNSRHSTTGSRGQEVTQKVPELRRYVYNASGTSSTTESSVSPILRRFKPRQPIQRTRIRYRSTTAAPSTVVPLEQEQNDNRSRFTFPPRNKQRVPQFIRRKFVKEPSEETSTIVPAGSSTSTAVTTTEGAGTSSRRPGRPGVRRVLIRKRPRWRPTTPPPTDTDVTNTETDDTPTPSVTSHTSTSVSVVVSHSESITTLSPHHDHTTSGNRVEDDADVVYRVLDHAPYNTDGDRHTTLDSTTGSEDTDYKMTALPPLVRTSVSYRITTSSSSNPESTNGHRIYYDGVDDKTTTNPSITSFTYPETTVQFTAIPSSDPETNVEDGGSTSTVWSTVGTDPSTTTRAKDKDATLLKEKGQHKKRPGNHGKNNLHINDIEYASSEKQMPNMTVIIIVGAIVAGLIILGIVVGVVLIYVQRKKRAIGLEESDTSSEFNHRHSKSSEVPSSTVVGTLATKLPRISHVNWEPAELKPSPWEFPREKLRLQTILGQGNFGQVWKAEAEGLGSGGGSSSSGNGGSGGGAPVPVAVKMVKEQASVREKQSLLREIAIMQQIGSHTNVVSLLGCCTQKEPYFLIMEYVRFGKLLTFLRDHRNGQEPHTVPKTMEELSSYDLIRFTQSVANGMEFIASKGIIHRDLAARNVLIDHNKVAKIADFGLSRNLREAMDEMYEQRGKGALPIRWMAPESLFLNIFSPKSDVWAFGILMWEIITLGSTPYPGLGAREVMRRVREGYRLERPSHCRPDFYRLITRCWHSDMNRRPDFTDLSAELRHFQTQESDCIDLANFPKHIYFHMTQRTTDDEKL